VASLLLVHDGAGFLLPLVQGGGWSSSSFIGGGGGGPLSLFMLLHWVCLPPLVGGPLLLLMSPHCPSIIIVVAWLWLCLHLCIVVSIGHCPSLSSSICTSLTDMWHMDSKQWGGEVVFYSLALLVLIWLVTWHCRIVVVL